jgi:thiamine pyrophosphate-dependent acetolactate synthase large subunit-like protein
MSLLNRRDAVRELLRERGELIVVAGLGAPAYDLASCGNQPLDFPLWGAMGGAAMVGLGVARAQPRRRVVVITGDGEMLMGLGSLATIGVQQPTNLSIVVIDNERYGETGMQTTHTAHGVDLQAVAKGCNLKACPTELSPLRKAIHEQAGPNFAVIKVQAEKIPLVLPPREGALLKARFRRALLGPEADSV